MSSTAEAYKKAGVDIDAGEQFAEMIRLEVEKAWPGAGQEIGGFAGGGPIPKGALKVFGSSDGAGTKAILAALLGRLTGIGQDAAAMSLVDAYVDGKRPAYLLNTLKVGNLKPLLHIRIIKSIIQACKKAGCRLTGGETAEMPGLFRYDWMIDLDTTVISFPDPALKFVPVKTGQGVYGWPSYGVAANGFSLVRDAFGLDLDHLVLMKERLKKKWFEIGNITLAKALLKPTPIWIRQIEGQRRRRVKFAGHAHITGGGMPVNIPRILPAAYKVVIQRDAWVRPGIFPLIQFMVNRRGEISDEEMDQVFNQGIMVVSFVDPGGAAPNNPKMMRIGKVVDRRGNEPQVELVGKYRDE